MRERLHFTCTPKKAQDLADLLTWSYSTMVRKGHLTYEQFEEDVRSLPFGTDPLVDKALLWCRETCVTDTTKAARIYASRALNVSNDTSKKRTQGLW